jgi:hypothetical protein
MIFDIFQQVPKFEGIADKDLYMHFESTQHDGLNTLELSHLVLLDMVRRNGIPKDWLQVECVNVTCRPGLKQTHLQLVMQRWSDRLLHYNAALQQQFLAGLDYFEPGVDHSNYVISWRFSNSCVMPMAQIPEGLAWH